MPTSYLMQMTPNVSYVVTDPKGTILVECGKMLQKGTPKMKDGKSVLDKKGKVIYEPYKIKVLNTINFKKSMHYNRATCSPLKRRRTALFQSVL